MPEDLEGDRAVEARPGPFPIDATIVRALLVPATMKLLGNAKWWAPGPMRRWWERYGIREVGAVAASYPAEEKELVTN